MKPEEFQKLTQELARLTGAQRKQVLKHLEKQNDGEAVGTIIEKRLQIKPACPKCGDSKIVRWGSADGLQRYRCRACQATFNALTGTPLARLRHKDKWIVYAQQMAEGRSIRNSANACSVHRNTSFRWRHRFLALPQAQKATNLAGIVEADETFFLESFKGKKRGMTRASRKHGGKAVKRGLSSEQVPVLICRDRAGCTADFVLRKIGKAQIGEALKPLLATDTILCSDSERAIAAVAREIGITHRPINVSAGIRVINTR